MIAGALATVLAWAWWGPASYKPHVASPLPHETHGLSADGVNNGVTSERGKPQPGAAPLDAPIPTDHAALLNEMVATAKQVLTDFPANPWAYDFQGRVYSYQGRTAEAERAWRQCLRLDARRPDACQGLAILAINRRDDATAERLLRQALEIDPVLPQATIRLADLLFRAGRMNESLAVLQAFLKHVPNSAEIYVKCGQIRLQDGDLEDAESDFRKGIELLPTSSEALFGLGTTLVRQGQREEARKYLEKAREIKSKISKPKPGTTASAADLRLTLKNCAGAYAYAAGLYLQAGNHSEAERLCRRAAKMDERNLRCRLLLIDIYQDDHRLPEAIQVCEELLAPDPENPEWIWRLGLLNGQLGRFDVAEEALRRVMRIEPNVARSYVSLVEVYRRSGREPRAALPLAEKAVQLEPTAAHYAMLGGVYIRLGNRKKALEAFEKAATRDPDNPRYRHLRAQPQPTH